MAGLVSAMPDAVSIELRRWAASPFDLARDNCGLAVLGYAERAMGRLVRRGRGIAGARAARRLMGQPDRFLAVSSALMRELGCEETDAPMRGDVGLVDMPAGLTACLATGASMWAARGDHAFVLQAGPAVIAWRVPCPRR